MAQYDLLIRGGTVVDGTGSAPRIADIAVSGGLIVEIGERIEGNAREVIDAAGQLVTPGWIDPHTHYDGQATWDSQIDPSSSHGVTTVIMGNCGVGFAPVRPGGHPDLIDIMEGVEDIPGTALYEAMPWGAWETYAEYLDHLRARHYAVDIGSHIAHGALRAYVMGPEDLYRKKATDVQIGTMAKMVEEGMRAGALGFSTSRIMAHRSLSGEQVPGTFASEEELTALICAMGSTGAGVMQLIPGGLSGIRGTSTTDPCDTPDELAMMGRLSRASGRPITYTLFQIPDDPAGWREVIARNDEENSLGAQLSPQVSARQPGLLMSLGGYHPLQRRETYLKLRHLPLPERVREMQKPDIKAAILADRDIPDDHPGSTEDALCKFFSSIIGRLFPLGAVVNYEPDRDEFIERVAEKRQESEQSVLYDMLLEHEGTNVLMFADINYCDFDLNAVREMFMHPSTVSGLSDAGAHVKFICDASIPTFMLTHFVRDRVRGPRIPIEIAVAKLSARTADLYGLTDRGRLVVGKRADINLIDFDGLTLGLPVMHQDLPLGASRFLQPASGYRATFVNGVMTRWMDQDTGQRPGRLLSGAAMRP